MHGDGVKLLVVTDYYYGVLSWNESEDGCQLPSKQRVKYRKDFRMGIRTIIRYSTITLMPTGCLASSADNPNACSAVSCEMKIQNILLQKNTKHFRMCHPKYVNHRFF